MGKKWVTAFAAAPREARMGTEVVVGRTIRLETVVNLTGDTVRLRLGNLYGETPMRIGGITLWNGRSSAEITFGGIPSLKLAPGHSLQSDEVYLPVRAGDRLKLIHVFEGLETGTFPLLDETTGDTIPLTGHFTERQQAILRAGGLLDYTREGGK